MTIKIKGESGAEHDVGLHTDDKLLTTTVFKRGIKIEDVVSAKAIKIDIEKQFRGYNFGVVGVSASREVREYAKEMGILLFLPEAKRE